MSPVRVAVAGLGVMGANHARVVATHGSTELMAVCDIDGKRANAVGDRFGVPSFTSWEALPKCDAVIIATPTYEHGAAAAALLNDGTPVLVEKPLSDDLETVHRLLEISTAGDVPLMCGFVERFNPAIQCARSLIDGVPIHLLATRHSPVTPRATASVVYDLLIHDLDTAIQLMSPEVAGVDSRSWTGPGGLLELTDCTLGFEGGAVATLSASRVSQRKIRTLQITTLTAQIEVDMLRHDVTVYRHRSHEQLDFEGPTYRADTIIDIPFVQHMGEPLHLQLSHLVELARGEADPAAERSTLLAPHRIADEIERQGE